MPKNRPTKQKKRKPVPASRIFGRPGKAVTRPLGQRRRAPMDALADLAIDPSDIERTRAEAEAAIAEARKSHERLREAIDILPQGVVFLDDEGRYILWNKKYAEIY